MEKKIKDRLLVSSLMKLGHKQWKIFGYFLDSPYHNSNDKDSKLFKKLQEEVLKGNSEMTCGEFFAVFFEEKGYDTKLNKRLHSLRKKFTEFLSYESLKNSSDLALVLAFEEMRKRGLYEFYEKTSRKLKEHLEKSERESLDEMNLSFRLKLFEAEYWLKKEQRDAVFESLTRSKEDLENLKLLFDLKYQCAYLNLNHISGGVKLSPSEKPQFRVKKDAPALIRIYLLILKIQEAERQGNGRLALQHYLAFSDLFKLFRDAFSPRELNDIIIYGLNFCIRRNNAGIVIRGLKAKAGNFRVEQEMDLWMERQRENYLQIGFVDKWDFVNYVTRLCKKGKLKEATLFCSQLKGKIVGENPGHAHFYALGLIAYYRGNLAESRGLLLKSQSNSVKAPYLNLLSRTILARVSYSQKELIVLEDHLEAFRMYLRRVKERKSLSKKRLEEYQNFRLFCHKLAHLQGQMNKKALVELKQDVLKAGVVSSDWLLRMIRDLENKKPG